jgi:hypothetical protein
MPCWSSVYQTEYGGHSHQVVFALTDISYHGKFQSSKDEVQSLSGDDPFTHNPHSGSPFHVRKANISQTCGCLFQVQIAEPS